MPRKITLREELTCAKLRELLIYDPLTGIFRWRVRPYGSKTAIGDIAGTLNTLRYRVIAMLGKQKFYGHRLAWLYMTGTWPTHEIDHKDGNPANNAWSNLRPPKRTQNCRNTRRPRHNTSGIKGVMLIRLTHTNNETY